MKRNLVLSAPKYGRLDKFNIDKAAKLVARTNEHTLNVDGEPFLSDVEEDEAIVEDE